MATGLVCLVLALCLHYIVGNKVSCSPGYWGISCLRECHCTEGVCEHDTGVCANSHCSPGWAKPPTCQVPCSTGTFGLRCQLICHCTEGDICNHVNGMCASGTCRYGFDGAGCQIKLPVFISAPNVTLNIDEPSLNITWRPWSPAIDIGDPPIAQYTLQYSDDNNKSWKVTTKLNATNQQQFFYHVMKVIKYSKYSFRLLVSRYDNEKLRPSIPGPSSTALVICQRPSNAPLLLQVLPKAGSRGSGLLQVSWQAPPDGSHNCHVFENYIIKIWCDVTAKCKTRETVVPSLSRTSTESDLPLDAFIFVQVIAVNDAGLRSYPSNSIVVVIKAPVNTVAALTKTHITMLNDNSGLLTFTDHNYKVGDKIQYKVTLNVLETHLIGLPPSSKTIYTQLQRIPLEGLSPATHYKVIIEKLAETERVIVNSSAIFWTKPVNPEIEEDLSVEKINDNSVTIRIPKVDTRSSSSLRGLILFLEVREGHVWHPAEVQDYISTAVSSQPVVRDSELFIAKEIPHYELSYSQIFTINSDSDKRLEKGKLYDVWYCVESRAGEQSNSTCKPVISAPNSAKFCNSVFVFGRKDTKDCTSEKSKVGLAFLCVFIVVILILLVLLVFYCKRNQLKKFSAQMRKNPVKLPNFGSVSRLVPHDSLNASMVGQRNAYQNISCMGITNVADIEAFLQQKQIANILLKDYFSQLPKKNMYSADEGQKIENAHLNRSSLFLPYDRNRIELPVSDLSATDYINASVVKVLQGRSYIVTEAPTTVTAQRFWLMIWHCNIERIVMLVDVGERIEPPCELYWNDERSQVFGEIKISVLSLRRYANYTVRVMELTNLNQDNIESDRLIHHYQYKNWNSVDDIPASVTSFVEFVEVSGLDCNPGAFCAVHCEYGTGRSGMFMLSEVLKQEAIKKGSVNLFATACRMCAQRGSLIANVHQYKFIHLFLVESVLHHKETLTKKQFMEHYKQIIVNGDNSKLTSEFNDLYVVDERMEMGDASFMSHRFVSPNSSPSVSHPTHMASWRKRNLEFKQLDSYETPGGLLVSVSLYDTHQIPKLLERLWESETTTVVTFGHNDESTKFWPGSELEKTYESVKLSVATTQLMRHKDFMVRQLALTKQQGHLRPKRFIRQFHYTPWPWEKPLPEPRSFAKLIQEVSDWKSESSPSYAPVYVQCSNGCTRSGMFCILWSVWERFMGEGTINVNRAVKAAQEVNPQFLTTIEQYKMCYRIAKMMIDLTATDEQLILSPQQLNNVDSIHI